MKPRQFWIVWSPQGEKSPRFRHDDEDEAVKEAERLARENPEKDFYVMESVCLRKVIDMQRIELRPDIPF